jgi:hypothetical protein
VRAAAVEALRRHIAVSPVHRGTGREHYTPLWRGYHGCKEARWSEGWRQEAWRRQETRWRQEAWWQKAPLGNALEDKEAGEFAGFFVSDPARRHAVTVHAQFRRLTSPGVACERELEDPGDQGIVRKAIGRGGARELTLTLQVAIRVHLDHEYLTRSGDPKVDTRVVAQS